MAEKKKGAIPKGSTADAAAASLPAAARPVLAAIAAGKVKPVYLVFGESFLVGAVAQALIEALVPAERRSFNLEVYDGRATPLVTILDSARTAGLFAGTKVIWVREAPMLQSSEKRSDTLKAIVDGVADGRMEGAGSRLLALIAAAGWSQEDFESRRISEMPASRRAQAFGEGADDAALAALDEVQAWAKDRGMQVSAAADPGEEMLARLEAGLPGVVMLFTAESVDSRKRLVKRLKDLGELLPLSVERERSGALKAESAAAIIDRIVAEHGKSLTAAARSRLMRRVGGDAAALSNEVEKLCLFAAGDAIQPAEVDAVVRDLGDAWIFDFTDALGNRDLGRALQVLRGLLAGGDHPLRILATLHSQIRLLLILRECLDGPWRQAWRPGTRADAFTRTLLPALSDEERADIGNMHPYRLSLTTGYAAKLPAARLRWALAQLADIDGRLKSSRGDPAVLLEKFVIDYTT